MQLDVSSVAALRARLWDAGFRPIAVLNAEHANREIAGKAPISSKWPERARDNPPEGVKFAPVAHALNTGILCDGLRAIDIDIDDVEIANQCRAVALDQFGEAPIRMRRNSPRCLLLYRASIGTPPKLSVVGKAGKVEVLGRGQQFVAFGRHPSGAELEWFPEAPGDERLESLPAINEDAIHLFLATVAPLIGAESPAKANGHNHAPGEPQASPLRIAAALNDIPNEGPPNWERWNYVGMAVWRATGGNQLGWEAWNTWSQGHPSYEAEATRTRWEHYTTSPPTEVGAGTIFWLARMARLERAARAQAPESKPAEKPQAAKPAANDDAPIDPLPLLWFADIEPMLDVRDFVQGVLMESASAVVYGQSNSGKTFWTTDLALHVAAGHPWNGLRVEQGGVVYCALEGGIGFRNRVAAWKEDRALGSYDLPFVAIPSALNLLDPAADTERLISAIKQAVIRMGMAVLLIVIDTLSRALAGGNENAPDDMGALVMNMDRIRAATGAMVLFVHHSGKDQAKGARGHSSLQAAIDTEIEVVEDEIGEGRTATVSKQRELRKGQVFPFTLRTVSLGDDRHGQPVTTCVVQVAEGQSDAPAKSAKAKLTGQARQAYDVLCDALAASGAEGFGAPAGVTSIPEKWWRDNFYNRAMPGAEVDAKKKAFRRSADFLLNRDFVAMMNGRVWVPRRPQVGAAPGETDQC